MEGFPEVIWIEKSGYREVCIASYWLLGYLLPHPFLTLPLLCGLQSGRCLQIVFSKPPCQLASSLSSASGNQGGFLWPMSKRGTRASSLATVSVLRGSDCLASPWGQLPPAAHSCWDGIALSPVHLQPRAASGSLLLPTSGLPSSSMLGFLAHPLPV